MSDPLDDALGIEPLPVVRRVPVVPAVVTGDADYEFARENIYRVTAKIEDALDELAEVARSSEHPRAYEVYANLAKTFIDANKDLLNLRHTAKESQTEADRGPTTVNNTLLISSEDMLRAVKSAIRGEPVAAPAKVIDG